MSAPPGPSRRSLFTGRADAKSKAGSHHISSAVVAVLPRRSKDVLAMLAGMDGVEVHAAHAGKIVVVLEGTSPGVLGDLLTRIALSDGVIAANMVYEQLESLEAPEE